MGFKFYKMNLLFKTHSDESFNGKSSLDFFNFENTANIVDHIHLI